MLPVQSKMARVAVGWGVRELAGAAQVSPDTVARLERGETLQPRTLAAIRTALEQAGVEFIEQNGGGPGVRLRADLALKITDEHGGEKMVLIEAKSHSPGKKHRND